ncbi:hypothetical protein CEE36_10140 [candidate division TA06 bacterium B3_TA06]|uniref:Uncharacterized protein n=1 Tax=candidate division TA06 bacterium B3_TA06 TaxID=2012487 RepID=A0A532UY64_UNCT6|nr:MAG: hypothetical protein CEE36_10140 [candidate division TA06 bacterium B3_TA06]
MTFGEIAALVASLVSIGIAVTAIWLSIKFYELSSKASKGIEKATKDIEHSVSKLEQIFNTLYSDTFAMMKDTVTEMRKHAWPSQLDSETSLDKKAVDEAIDRKISSIKKEVDGKVLTILKNQNLTESKIKRISTDLDSLLEKTLSTVRKVEYESKAEQLRIYILRELQKRPIPITAEKLVVLMDREGFRIKSILEELEEMKGEKLITWTGRDLKPSTKIKLL